MTPNGKFGKEDLSILMYGRQWSPILINYEKVILQLIGLMNSEIDNSYYFKRSTDQIRQYTKKSMQWNLRNEEFKEYFLPFFDKMRIAGEYIPILELQPYDKDAEEAEEQIYEGIAD